MAHIREGDADNTLMNRLHPKLETAIYFPAFSPSLLPLHLQEQTVQLLLAQLPLLNRMGSWYGRRDIDIPPDYTMRRCQLTTARNIGQFHTMPAGP